MLNFPYFVDQYDEPPEPVIARHGLTEYVLRTAKAIFATREKCAELVAMGEISDIGAPSVDWMGVPLILNNRAIGVMVVQSYTEGIRFSNEEMEILQFVSTQVAMVIERKRAEAELKELSQLNGEVISGVNTGIIVYDREGRHQLWNQYMVEMTGLPQEYVLGQSALEIFPLFRRANLMQVLEQAMTGEITAIPDLEYTVPPTGKSGWLGGYCGPHRNAKGEVTGVIAVINDISERKKADDALHSALIEKEVLLREIHHRVKNNLQVMSSLMSLQADTVDNEDVRQSFREMQTRVQTMALIHEELYQAKNLSRVNLAEYIGKLAAGLSQSFLLNPRVELEVDVEEAFLGVDTAIPCGLIVNELVTNAFKYAFPDNQPGKVLISLRSNADGVYNLTVNDNGVGLPSGLDVYQTETLGMQLITILAAQLGGKLDVELNGGTCFHIQFSDQWKN
jgi:PAS domain S-box-containing protein